MAEGEVNITAFDDAGVLNGAEKLYLVRGTTDYNTTPNAIVAAEANTRAAADTALQTDINNLSESFVYLNENEYQVLIDNDLVLPGVQYNIYEE